MNANRNSITNERGASAVEFAVIAPLLMLLIVAVIEFGLLLNRIQVYEGAAREGARAAAVREDSSTIEARIASAAGTYGANITGPISIAVIGGPASDPPCNDETSGMEVAVSWSQDFQDALDFPLFPGIDINDFEISGTFRCE
jgi:Flp pilus assembly protein TadG